MGIFKLHVPRTALINYGLLLAAVVAYVLLLYFAPQTTASTSNRLGLSQAQIDLIRLTIILPYVISWALAVYGLTTLKGFIQKAQDLEEEFVALLSSIHNGLLWIISGTVLTALIGALRPYFVSSPLGHQILTIIVNYMYILPLMVGFWLMYKGAQRMQIVKRVSWPQWRADNVIKTLIVVVLIGFYTFLTFTNVSRGRTYAMPDLAIALTIIVPVFVTWWLGFSTAFIMSDLIPRVTRASLFKAMTRFLFGIWSIIFTSILLQAISSLGPTRLVALGLGLVLVVVYLFVILNGLSYVFVALGVKNLRNPKPPKKVAAAT